MTTQQIAWASKHDWFVSIDDAGAEGQCVYVRDDMYEDAPPDCFTCFQSLLEWAGY
jgi:hypothetical protein